MQNNSPFTAQALTLPISVTATASASTALPAVGNSIRIVNEGPNVAFVSIGTGAQTATLPNATATATSTPVLAGSDIVLTVPKVDGVPVNGVYPAATPLNISAICRAAGTAILDVQVGEGI